MSNLDEKNISTYDEKINQIRQKMEIIRKRWPMFRKRERSLIMRGIFGIGRNDDMTTAYTGSLLREVYALYDNVESDYNVIKGDNTYYIGFKSKEEQERLFAPLIESAKVNFNEHSHDLERFLDYIIKDRVPKTDRLDYLLSMRVIIFIVALVLMLVIFFLPVLSKISFNVQHSASVAQTTP